MANRLGAAVDRKMLCAGGGFKILALSLQALDKRRSKGRRKKRVLAIGFVSSAPPGVAENVDIWTPKGKSLVYIVVTALVA